MAESKASEPNQGEPQRLPKPGKDASTEELFAYYRSLPKNEQPYFMEEFYNIATEPFGTSLKKAFPKVPLIFYITVGALAGIFFPLPTFIVSVLYIWYASRPRDT